MDDVERIDEQDVIVEPPEPDLPIGDTDVVPVPEPEPEDD
jgi:hypothetical protein